MIQKGGAVLVGSIKVWQLDTIEGIRVRITRIKKGGGYVTRKGIRVRINED